MERGTDIGQILDGPIVDTHADLPSACVPHGGASVRKRTVRIWYARTFECASPAILGRCQALLDDAESRRLHAFRIEAPRREYLLTRALCRMALSAHAAIPPGAWRFARGAHGRPYVGSPVVPGLPSFNLSNTAGIVACALSGDGRVGFDVERVRPEMDFETLVSRYFAPEDRAWLSKVPYERKRLAFFEHWVLKEAFAKALGLGLSLPLDAFSIARGDGRIGVRGQPGGGRGCGWQFHLGSFDAGCPFAVALEAGDADREFAIELHDATALLQTGASHPS